MFESIALVINICSIIIGLVVLFSLYSFYRQNRNVIFIYYAFFLLSFILMFSLDFIVDLSNIDPDFDNGSKTISILNFLMDFFNNTILISSPIFIIHIVPLKKKNLFNIFFGVIFCINVLFQFLTYFLFPELLDIYSILGDSSFILVGMTLIAIMLTGFKKIESDYLRKFIKFAAILTLSFLPFILIFEVVKLPISNRPTLSNLDYDIIFFIVWNLVSIRFFLKYFNLYAMNSFVITPTNEFLEKIGLSKREKEVFSLLIKGHSYSDISDMLFISHSTVKTHVLNIYKKANVKNKIALLQKIKEIHIK